jgi:hypothetical protein
MDKIDIPEQQPYEGKATQKQKQRIWELGFDQKNVIDELGKQQASYLIGRLIVIQTKRADILFYKKRSLLWLAGVVIFLLMVMSGKFMADYHLAPSMIAWGYLLSFGCFIAVLKNSFKLLLVKVRRNYSFNT